MTRMGMGVAGGGISAPALSTITNTADMGQMMTLAGGAGVAATRYLRRSPNAAAGTGALIGSAPFVLGAVDFGQVVVVQQQLGVDPTWRLAGELGPIGLAVDFVALPDGVALDAQAPWQTDLTGGNLGKLRTDAGGIYDIGGYVGFKGVYVDFDTGNGSTDHIFGVTWQNPAGDGQVTLAVGVTPGASNNLWLTVSQFGAYLQWGEAGVNYYVQKFEDDLSGQQVGDYVHARGLAGAALTVVTQVAGGKLTLFVDGRQILMPDSIRNSDNSVTMVSGATGTALTAKTGLASNQGGAANRIVSAFGYSTRARIAISQAVVADINDYTPQYKQFVLRGATTFAAIDIQVEKADGTVVLPWKAAGGSIASGTFRVTSDQVPNSFIGQDLVAKVRDGIGKGGIAKSSAVTMPDDVPAQPFRMGMNGGAVAETVTPADMFRIFRPLSQPQIGGSGGKDIRGPLLGWDGSQDYANPADYPISPVTGHPNSAPVGWNIDWVYDTPLPFHAAVYGDRWVDCSPGLPWFIASLNGDDSIVVLNGTDKRTPSPAQIAAGRAEIRVQAPVSGPSGWTHLHLTWGYPQGVAQTSPIPLPANPVFSIRRKDKPQDEVIDDQAVAYLSNFTGPIRNMGEGIANYYQHVPHNIISWATYKSFEAASFSFAGISVRDQLVIGEKTGRVPWINITTLLSRDAAGVGGMAQYLYNSACPLMYLEYSNEWFNNAFGFGQNSFDANTVPHGLGWRAVQAGVSVAVQYARELKQVIALFETVFGPNSPRLRWVVGDQYSYIGHVWVQAMLDEGELWRKVYGVAAGPYGGSRWPEDKTESESGPWDYNNTRFMSTAERNLALTDPVQFKAIVLQRYEHAVAADGRSWLGYSRAIYNYEKSKGLAAGTIRRLAYETAAQHDLVRNSPSPEYDAAARTLAAQIHISPEFGQIVVKFFEYIKRTGGEMIYFHGPALRGPMLPEFGSWAIMDRPTDVTQHPYVDLVNALAPGGSLAQ